MPLPKLGSDVIISWLPSLLKFVKAITVPNRSDSPSIHKLQVLWEISKNVIPAIYVHIYNNRSKYYAKKIWRVWMSYEVCMTVVVYVHWIPRNSWRYIYAVNWTELWYKWSRSKKCWRWLLCIKNSIEKKKWKVLNIIHQCFRFRSKVFAGSISWSELQS